MYLDSIHLQNFRQHRDTYIQFIRGITGILGQNGAGKSTILEAIAWALYGNKSGVLRGTKDYLIWRGAPGKSEVVVELKFVFQKHSYRILRSQSLTRTTAQLWQDEVLIANSIRGVDEKIGQVLSMTHQEFFNSYFTGQKELQFLGSIEGATARERFIAKMLGYEKIEEIQGKPDRVNTLRYDLKQKEKTKDQLEGYLTSFAGLGDKIMKQKQEIQNIKNKLEIVQQKFIQSSQNKEKLDPLWQQIQDKRTEFLQLQTKLQGHQSRLQDSERELRFLEQRQNTLQQELDQFNLLRQAVLPYENLQKEYQVLEQSYQSFVRAEQTKKMVNNLEQDIKAILTELNALEPIGQKLATLQQTIAAYRTQLTDRDTQIKTETLQWQQIEAELRAKINLERQTLAKVEKQHQTIIDAGEEGACPTCERPLQEEYGNVVDGFLGQINQSHQNISQWQVQMKQLAKKPTVIIELEQSRSLLQNELDQCEQQQRQLSQDMIKKQVLEQQLDKKQQELYNLKVEDQEFDLDYFQAVQGQIKQLRPQYETFLRLAQTPQNFNLVMEQIDQKRSDLQALNQIIADIQAEIFHLNFSDTDFISLQKQREEALKHYNQTQEEYRSIGQELNYTEQQLQQLNRQNEEFVAKEAELKGISLEYLTLKELDQAFSLLRQYLTEQIRPRLADSASYFLQQLTEGRYDSLEIDEKYQVIVQDQGENKPVISGGEEDIVNLSLRLAISQMITERTGQSFSLLILDEVFGSLDYNRRDNVIQLLHRLEQQFEQVLIITHIEDIKESLSQTIRLAFDADRQHTIILTE